MKTTLSEENLAGIFARLETEDAPERNFQTRQPVHVVYGGANLFRSDTPAKFGRLAVKSIETYAPNFAEFANAMWLKGAETLPLYDEIISDLESRLHESPENVKIDHFPAFFAHSVYRKTIEKLGREPVEDFRIDFEDGYGFRPDAEEDRDAIKSSDELADSYKNGTITPFCGFRIKSLAPETSRRAIRTLDLFLTNFLDNTGGSIPENFAVTLPKVTRREEVGILCELIDEFEKANDLETGAIKIEIVTETPQAFFDENGSLNLRNLVKAANGRCVAAHFGAYDFTSGFGIASNHQHLRHQVCDFARDLMQIALAPLNIRLSDSITNEMPIPVHRGEILNEQQTLENKRCVQKAWRAHFNNVTHSLINGFYQSWDLHPAQLPARYAAVYAFFLEAEDAEASRLKNFISKATQAALTGNTFDDAASANGLLNFFRRGISCGAFDAGEVSRKTGLSNNELNSSFAEIMKNRES